MKGDSWLADCEKDCEVISLEIYSPGGMMNGTMVQNLDVLNVPSRRRNPVIADIFNRLRYMDRRGFNISTEDLKECDRLMLNYGISKTTVGMYFRTFRVIWNVCEKKGFVTSATYPFGKGDDKVAIASGATRKSFYLTVEHMTELYNCFLEKRYPEE